MLSIFAAAAADESFQPSDWLFENVWIVPAIMLTSFVYILFFGKTFPGKDRVHYVGLAAISVSLLFSLFTAFTWVTQYEDEQGSHSAQTSGFVDPAIITAVDAGEEGDKAKDSSRGCLAESNVVGDLRAADDEYALGSLLLTDAELAVDAGEDGAKTGHIKAKPVVRCLEWFSTGAFVGDSATGDTLKFHIGTIADGQSIMMLVVVTFISFLVHLYSTEYVKGDRRYVHYYAFLSLFTASMLFMVLSSSTLQLIVGWELVGVCSFGLIGHWWEEKPNSDAALKAFLTNRVGDIGLLVGMIVLFFGAGQTFDIQTINYLAVHGGLSQTTMTVAALCLMTAVMSKSGQFILHTWLPDAMAGPTPVSALIHAATMVVAGVYMIGRLYPVFWFGMSIEGSPINALAFVGALTVVGGGALAFVQNDVKKVLAYSTVSQLGYMVLALGVGAYTAGMFHLFTHAFFKACLFLGAGALSHACHHSFDMKAEMGGLRKRMPVTFATFMIGTLALVGVFPFAGFWSKDEILVGTGGFPSTNANGNYTLLLIMGLIGAAMTAGYMTRVIWLVFFGEYRGHVDPHDPPPVMKYPLIILAGLSVVTGFLNFPADWFGGLGKRFGLKFEQWVEPARGDTFPVITHGDSNLLLAVIASAVGVASAALVWGYYQKLYAKDPSATEVTEGLRSKSKVAAGGYALLENKYYLDDLYQGGIADPMKGPIARAAYWFNQNVIDEVVNTAGRTSALLGRFVYKYIDQGAIDGSVNLSGTASSESGGLLRKVQTGRVRNYASLMFGAAALLAAVFILAI